MTPKDRIALAAYMEMLDDTVDLRNDSVGMDGGDPVRLLLAEHDRLADDLRRLRISQLRRTRDAIASKAGGWANILRDIPEGPRKSWRRRWLDRMERLDAACLAEIERLRGLS